MSNLINQLKKLKDLRPSADFSRHSRLLILKSDQPAVFRPSFNFGEILKFSTALSVVAALTIGTIGIITYLERSPLPLIMAGLDIPTLTAEAENMKLDISLEELDYYQSNPQVIEVALGQTASTDPVYFEKIVLNKETSIVDLTDPVNRQVDKALEAILELE